MKGAGKSFSVPFGSQTISNAQRAVAAKALPGMQPVDGKDWLRVDAAYTDQLATKAALLETHADKVLTCLPEAREAATETLDEILKLLAARADFEVEGDAVKRPDGKVIKANRGAPLHTLSQLIQEDICILQKQGKTHRLTAALLCFPASWTLSEKIGRELLAIHAPVQEYTDNIARRVQRLFDGVRPGHPIWRANLLSYEDPRLYQPKSEGDERSSHPSQAIYERSERQTLWRLPKCDAVVFSIHTSVRAKSIPKHP